MQVVAGILQRDQEVLVAQRPEGKHGAGFWEFPGGKVEDGESATAALQRELLEELGIDIGDTADLCVIEHDYAERSVRLNFQRVLDWQGVPRACEQQQIRWVSLNDIDAVEFLPANREVVARLKNDGALT
ncbi:MAG: 8-oxo-dGTP diphosphatase MutT [Pseudomonadota bacterium]